MSEATVQRILAHMNKDHRLALEDYLYVYGGVSVTDQITNVRMLNIELEYMTLQFHHGDVGFDIEKTILLEPPLKDWAEAKERLVTMAHQAADKRRLSYIQVNDMSYPGTILEYFVIIAAQLPLICYTYRQVLYWLPVPLAVKQYLDSDLKLLGVAVLALLIHLFETLFLLRPRLEFYRVPTDFLIEWYLFGILEGYAPVRRLERMARLIESGKKD